MRYFALIAAVAAISAAQGLNYNASKSNTGNLVISDGTNCTTVAAALSNAGSVTAASSTVTTCGVSNGVYFLPTNPAQSVAPIPTFIPQFVDGASWQTTVGFVNTTATSGTASLSCYQETGASDSSTIPWAPPFVQGANNQSVTLPAGGTLFLDTPGTSAELSQGWCQVLASDGVQVFSRFTWSSTSGGQGIAPAAATGSDVLVPYDNTKGSQTALAIANTTSSAETVLISFEPTSGAITTSSLILMPNGHKAFLFPTQFPSTANQRGQAEFRFQTKGAISVVPIQFNAADSFTTAQAYPVNNGPIISATDPAACLATPTLAGCSSPLYLVLSMNVSLTIAGGTPVPLQINVTPNSNGSYTASITGTINGQPVSGSLSGTYVNASTPWVFDLPVTGQTTFNGGQLAITLNDVVIDGSTSVGSASLTGTITLNQSGVGTGQITGRCMYIYFPGLISG
jgi:hypothetical protein